MRRARLQGKDGGVLDMTGGSATFESVAISDTSSAQGVRVAWVADRAGTELSGGVQSGGVVTMDDGAVAFKGGSIARSSAVRDPRC
jgi:hypothetical protein